MLCSEYNSRAKDCFIKTLLWPRWYKWYREILANFPSFDDTLIDISIYGWSCWDFVAILKKNPLQFLLFKFVNQDCIYKYIKKKKNFLRKTWKMILLRRETLLVTINCLTQTSCSTSFKFNPNLKPTCEAPITSSDSEVIESSSPLPRKDILITRSLKQPV